MTTPNIFTASAPLQAAIRELDDRNNDGIDVRLLWDSQNNRVWVTVEDERSGQLFWFEAKPADALAAFHHPYPYAYASRECAERRAAAGATDAK